MLDFETPVWLPVVGYEGLYSVSSNGDVMSHKTGKVMSKNPNNYGYIRISLKKDGKRYDTVVHRLVAIAFLPNPEGLTYVNHIDADRTNNCLSNLEWISPTANLAHAVALGNRDFVKEENIPDDTIREIRRRYVERCPVDGKQALAKEFNIHPERIRKIVNNLTYKSVF